MGMIAAEGILTSRGGKTSHAAVVARGMGKTCVCGAEELEVDTGQEEAPSPPRTGHVISEGDVISIDGTSGAVYLGEVPVVGEPGRAVLRGRARRRRRRRWSLAVDRHHAARRRSAPPGGPRQRRHPRGRARARRFGAAGDRPVPHRAHVPRRAPPAGRGPDPRRATDARPGSRRARRTLLPLQRDGLRRDPRGDGRPAGDDPADRPAAARVPARPHRALRQGRAGAGEARRRPRAATCGCSTRSAGCTSRTRCSGCAACGSAWSSRACSTCRSRAIARGGEADRKAVPAATRGSRDHDPARRRPSRSWTINPRGRRERVLADGQGVTGT